MPCEENTNIKQFSNTNWGSYSSPQFRQYLPTGSITPCKLRAQSFKTTPLPFRSQIINPGCHCVSELPTKVLKDLINLLDPLTKFWEIFHLLDYQLIFFKKKKRCNSRTVLWYTGQLMGQRAEGFHVLRNPRTQHLHMLTSPEVLPISPFQVFMEVSLHGNWLSHGAGDWTSNPLPLQVKVVYDWKFQPSSNHWFGFPGNQSPTSQAFQSHH